MSDTSDQQLLREVEDQSAWGPEEKRLRTIRARRRTQGECILCGKHLGFFDKWSKRTQHKNCTLFVE
jgi:hypothetical protein